MAPPKPRLVLRIGVTGHRPNRFGTEAQAVVAAKLDTVLRQITDAAAELHRRYAAMFSAEPPEVRVVSALAEGADRVVAEAALKHKLPLDVILPFRAAVYAEDFATPAAKAAFAALLAKANACFVLPGMRSSTDPAVANRAYEAVGLMTLRQTDLIIAVWDGRDAAGRGGTGAVIQSALISGQPVLRFDAAGEGPFHLTGSDAVLTDAIDIAARTKTIAGADEIKEVVARLCAPPGAGSNSVAIKRLKRFLKESERRRVFSAPWHPLILALFSNWRGFWRSFFRPPYVVHARKDWAAYSEKLKDLDPGFKQRIDDVVLQRFAWADRLADHYGQLHRSGYISNYLLSAVAVGFAALGAIGPDLPGRWRDIAPEWAPICEIAAIVFIAATVWHGYLRHWHTRWLEYRHLSGQLRSLRALVLTGSATGEARSPRPDEPVEPGSDWTAWYCRLTAREVGLPNFAVEPQYVEMVRTAISEGEIDDQIEYHTKTAGRMKSVDRWLERLSHAAFILTALACLYELVPQTRPSHAFLQGLLSLLCIVLPAFGAALFGISVHGEFAVSAERSEHMVELLTALGERLKREKNMSFATLSALTEYAAMTMAGEIGSWHVIYRARPLALPA